MNAHCPMLAALALLMAAPAGAAITEIAWDTAGRFEHRQRVAPGQFAEVCGKLPAGQAVAWQFEADRALDFNIHYHVGKEVVFAVKLDGVARASDTLRVQAVQDHCWMWRNTGDAPALLKLRLGQP